MKSSRLILLSFLLTVLALAGCRQSTEVSGPVNYDGPLRQAQDVDMLYSENDRVKVKLKAKKILEFKNNDREFPEGIYLEFYDAKGILTSTLKANHAFYFKELDQWRGRGNVEVVNIEKKQQLNTEELFWWPGTRKISTEKFVTIKLENEIIYGTGLDALQDLSSYTIRKPAGSEFTIKD
ncbi:MAG TPA: LPS export ABC transporter periplasmic protein LptC [Cyclobacteriaceae bacterium]|nr:LPS export ABC transporter periplasmic protein LptC [Cyclobacteriaceae bacterium]